MAKNAPLIPHTRIESRIYLVRDHKVMLDEDLAGLYGVTTSALNQAVTRNIDRFPDDFAMRLTWEEARTLRSQSVTLKKDGRGQHPKYPPRAFTEQGVAMLSSVLRSQRAVEVNIAIMRTFARMREAMISHRDLARQLNEMERKYDGTFQAVFDALRHLMQTPESKNDPSGYIHPKD